MSESYEVCRKHRLEDCEECLNLEYTICPWCEEPIHYQDEVIIFRDQMVHESCYDDAENKIKSGICSCFIKGRN